MSWDEVNLLVEQAQCGDREAFGELVKRFEKAVQAMALSKLHDPQAAEELAQDVFVHALRKLPQLRDPRCFAGWLRMMTSRMALNRLSRKGPFCTGDGEFLDSVPDRETAPQEELERDERKAHLSRGLRQLKKLDRQTLEAFYLRGQSLEQMAAEFNAPLGTIKRRLHVARLRLKDVLQPVEV